MIVKVITTDLGMHFAWFEESTIPAHVLTYTTSSLFAQWYGYMMRIDLFRNDTPIESTYVAEYGTHAPILGFRRFKSLKQGGMIPIIERAVRKGFRARR